ncbi:hypothetical protein P7K49_035067 [Saguinus oedipus]|uniref:Uncharacterized protein n=1 Tax=Saguinus oedipus TaxID=9490 RepID=A0ABQ9TXC7_SAGOE|nr:hypothetical protein P7K49_035067 [Saguinus oedipus]
MSVSRAGGERPRSGGPRCLGFRVDKTDFSVLQAERAPSTAALQIKHNIAGEPRPAPAPVRRRSSNYRAYATEPHAKVGRGFQGAEYSRGRDPRPWGRGEEPEQ